MGSGVFLTPLDAEGKRKFPEIEASFQSISESGVDYYISLKYNPGSWWDGFRHLNGRVTVDRLKVRMSRSRRKWETKIECPAIIEFGDTLTIYYKVNYEGRC